MSVFNKFPSIEQFRHFIKKCKFDGLSEVEITGTVKLHGTNAGIRIDENGFISFQSRNRVITTEDDNSGFANHFSQFGVIDLESLIYQLDLYDGPITIFGEWCGQGIQRSVGISELPKMFVTFAVQYGDGGDAVIKREGVSDKEMGIYSVYEFPTFKETLNVNFPEECQQRLVAITEAVEAECPVAASFGVKGVGEGVVWTGGGHTMKVKGDKHSASKVSKLKSPEDLEHSRKLKEFAENYVTEARMNQAIDFLKEMGHDLSEKSTGHFIRWIFNDIIKEESDTMAEWGLEKKDVGKSVPAIAKGWYFNWLGENA